MPNISQYISATRLPNRNIIFVFISLIIGTGLIYLIINWAISPSVGDITRSTYRQTQGYPLKTFSSKYVSFKYYGYYEARKLPPSGQDPEDYMLTANTDYDKRLAEEVSPMPSGGMANFSDYTYRRVTPQLYTGRSITVDGQAASEWIKNDGSEVTVFIPEKDYVVTLAFTTDSAEDQLQPEVSALLQTFQWKDGYR